MQTTYSYRKFYNNIGLATLILGIVVTLLKLFVMQSFAFSFFLIFTGYLQVKRYSKPYLILENNSITIHTSFFKPTQFFLEEIEAVEKREHKLILKAGEQTLPIFLNFLTSEDRTTLKRELPIWIHGETEGQDFSAHLVE